jgi:hypothetical protein
MKKLVLSLVLGASLAVVPSAFALKAMTADNMKDTTGQAGVSIVVDDIMIYQSSFNTTTYTDMDGVGTDSTAGGSLTIATTHTGGVLTTLRAIVDKTDRGGYLQRNYSAILAANGMNNIGASVTGQTSYDVTFLGTTNPADIDDRDGLFNTAFIVGNATGFIGRPIEIDVAGALRLASYGYSLNVNGTGTGVRIAGISIGLPTLEINRIEDGESTKIITVTSNAKTSAQENYVGGTNPTVNPITYGQKEYANEFIRITKSGNSCIAILGGTVEIAPH